MLMQIHIYIFTIYPRASSAKYGAQQHLIDIDSRFEKPSKAVDKKYSGDYDLYLKRRKRIIRVEVKASRAINTKIRGGLETKALRYESKEPFWMNFQQIKLNAADVFVFIGVWLDKILYWVLTNKAVKEHPTRSHQHRGGIEYQIGITNKNIREFKKFLVEPAKLVEKIIEKSRGQYERN